MIDEIARRIRDNQLAIKDYVSRTIQGLDVPVYSSFDIRNSGYKVTPIDPNVYPAGFNNVCQESLKEAAPVLEGIILKRFSENIHRIGIYTEDHTRNKYYLQNLKSLLQLFDETGFSVLLVTTNDSLDDDPAGLETAMGDTVHLHQLKRDGSSLLAGRRELDLIISNNDFSSGVPRIIKESPVPVTPLPEMGWWKRKKSEHFEFQHEILGDLAELINLDPWHFIPITESIDDVDFEEKEGFDRVAEAIESILERTRRKYREHGVDEEPATFVKSNQGTYGMGVYRFDSGEEFLSIDRDTRDSMARRKGGELNDSVIVQEGIRTVDRLESLEGELVAEPVIYCFEHHPVGGFLRTNAERSDLDNLNSRGMNFSSEDLCTLFVDDVDKNEGSNITQAKIDIYKFLGTVGSIACGREVARCSRESS